MKFANTRLLVALAATLGATQAHAFAPTSAHDLVVYIGGASAFDKSAVKLIKTTLCDTNVTPDMLDITLSGTTDAPASNGWGISCQSSKLGTTPSTVKVLFIKRSKDGSAMGVQPMVQQPVKSALTSPDAKSPSRGTQIPFLNVSNCKVNTDAGQLPNYWKCGAGTATDTAVYVDGGLSDVGPSVFRGQGINEPAITGITLGSVTPSQLQLLNVQGAAAQVFGATVTDSLYKALQEAQFGLGNACVGTFTEACMPSLSREQLASLYAGKVKKWSDIKVNGVALTDPTVISNNTITDTKVYICRRDGGSGTQANLNALILNAPCSQESGAIAPAFAANALKKPLNTQYPGAIQSDALNGPVVLENLSGGNAQNCQDDLDKGANTSGQNSTLGKGYAIGWLGTDANATHGKNFRFIKIDGVAPTLVNAWNGSYPYWGELTIQWRQDLATKAGTEFTDGANKLAVTGTNTGANKVKALTALKNALSQPATMATLNASIKHSFGDAGFLVTTAANAALTPVTSAADLASKPILNYSHAISASVPSPDFCRAPTTFNTSTTVLK